MFAKTIIDSDAFLDMPSSTQALYFHLGMRADDDGFINNPRKIQRVVGASDDDLRLLAAKGFIIPFESGVVVIKHWRIHNYIQKDRYKETVYQEEKSRLTVKDNKAYTLSSETPCIQDVSTMDTECVQDVYGSDTQISIDQISVDKNRLKEKRPAAPRFAPPTIEEVRTYCQERKNQIDPESFVDYYERQGWVLSNGQKMKDWKATVRTWEKRDADRAKAKQEQRPSGSFYRMTEHPHTAEEDAETERNAAAARKKFLEKWKD